MSTVQVGSCSPLAEGPSEETEDSTEREANSCRVVDWTDGDGGKKLTPYRFESEWRRDMSAASTLLWYQISEKCTSQGVPRLVVCCLDHFFNIVYSLRTVCDSILPGTPSRLFTSLGIFERLLDESKHCLLYWSLLVLTMLTLHKFKHTLNLWCRRNNMLIFAHMRRTLQEK